MMRVTISCQPTNTSPRGSACSAVVFGASVFLPLPRRGDVQDLSVLRDRAAGDVDPLLLQLDHDLVVVQRVVLVLVLDDRLELLLHGVPRHVLALGAGRAAGEEAAE